MLIEKIGEPAMLEALAEECSELTQASLKLARYIRGENPTPKSLDDIIDNFTEEIADVLICINEIKNPHGLHGIQRDDIVKKIDDWTNYKRTKIISKRFPNSQQ